MSSRRPTRKSKGKAKIIDKWKEKSWFQVFAPDYITDKSLGETPASEPELLHGRVIEMAKMGIVKDLFYDINLKLRFKITKVEGNICRTEFIGHEVAKEQIRSQIRRNRSKIEIIQNVTTKDKAKLRISSIIITPMRCGTSTQKVIRREITNLIKSQAKEQEFVDFTRNMVDGTISEDVGKTVRKIFPTVLADIRKSKVLVLPGNKELATI